MIWQFCWIHFIDVVLLSAYINQAIFVLMVGGSIHSICGYFYKNWICQIVIYNITFYEGCLMHITISAGCMSWHCNVCRDILVVAVGSSIYKIGTSHFWTFSSKEYKIHFLIDELDCTRISSPSHMWSLPHQWPTWCFLSFGCLLLSFEDKGLNNCFFF